MLTGHDDQFGSQDPLFSIILDVHKVDTED